MKIFLRTAGCLLLLASFTLGAEETDKEAAIAAILAHYAGIEQVHGSFRDEVTRSDDNEEEPMVLHAEFWLAQPNRYHFIIRENDHGDQQHYLSDGQQRWEVEVVLDRPLVERQAAQPDDPFARVQRLLQLDRQTLEEDFAIAYFQPQDELPEAVASIAFPESWQGTHLLWLRPRTDELAQDLRQVVLVFADDYAINGLVIDDQHHNRRTVSVLTLTQVEEPFADELFRWAEDSAP